MAAGIAIKTDEQIEERLDERCIATIRTLHYAARGSSANAGAATSLGV